MGKKERGRDERKWRGRNKALRDRQKDTYTLGVL
jgi:hypothetical protein